ncbi:hypothetical protein PAXINDRAFT_163090 [Paxillus involutus ATCC 200175]|uniref:Unplaced genomic scaffold PAXINscaffold_15, whole genome shotgun sequence n=1 Tax=Paxillus involutus ATCC 200175 TaxID=664439 RepID=A0A0C9SZ14_PAXIN|nr:hypothetical protein PAXINDRAFT_163090 [Paxillus involutus ATCC 200175]
MLSSARCSLHRQLARHIRLTSSNAPPTSTDIVARSKRRQQGGRNLSERYRRLENAIRGKEALLKQASALSQGPASAAELQFNKPTTSSTSKGPNIIAGFAILEEPRPPADDECCMSGCAICVYDLYEESLAAYKESVVALRSALSAMNIPENKWPPHIRTSQTQVPSTTTHSDKTKGAVLDAFEEMERALKEKREKRAAVETES